VSTTHKNASSANFGALPAPAKVSAASIAQEELLTQFERPASENHLILAFAGRQERAVERKIAAGSSSAADLYTALSSAGYSYRRSASHQECKPHVV
jgi:hypothetical protein